jgi:hypothetical protein
VEGQEEDNNLAVLARLGIESPKQKEAELARPEMQ